MAHVVANFFVEVTQNKLGIILIAVISLCQRQMRCNRAVKVMRKITFSTDAVQYYSILSLLLVCHLIL